MTSSFLQDTTSMALKGASIGSLFPGSGTLIGGIGGAVFGGAMNLLGIGSQQPEKSKKVQKRKAFIRFENDIKKSELYRTNAIARQQIDIAFKLAKDEQVRENYNQYKDYIERLDKRAEVYNSYAKIRKESVKDAIENFKLSDYQSTMAMNDVKRIRNERLDEIAFSQQQLVQAQEAANLISFFSDETLDMNNELKKKAAELARQDQTALVTDAKNRLENQSSAVEQTIAASMAEAGLQTKDLQRQVQNATASANLSRQELALARDKNRAQASFETQKARLAGLRDEGKVYGTGQSGRSVAKLAQAERFASASAQNVIASAVTRADAQYDLDISKIAQSLRDSRISAENKFAGIEQSMKNLAAEGGLKKTQLTNQFNEIRAGAERKLADINLKLLQDQRLVYQQKRNNVLNRFNQAQQLKINLNKLAASAQSAEDQFLVDKNYNMLQQFVSNKRIADQIVPAPRMPRTIAPPTGLPAIVQQFQQPMDMGEIEKYFKMAERAASPTATGLSFGQQAFGFLDTLTSGAAQVAKIINQNRVPDPLADAGNEFFPLGGEGLNMFDVSDFDFNLGNISGAVPDFSGGFDFGALGSSIDMSAINNYDFDLSLFRQ